MAKKRIVVTGMGVVSCFGNDVDHFYEQLLAGKSGIVPIEEFPCSEYPTRFAGAIRNFDANHSFRLTDGPQTARSCVKKGNKP